MLDLDLHINLRQGVKLVQTNEYARIAQDLQFQKFAKVLPSDTLKQTYLNLLENAVLKDYGPDGGAVRFEEQVFGQQTYTNHVFKTGWDESENKFQDMFQGIVGGEGITLLSQWTKNATARAAYQPQYLTVAALRNGESTSMTLDGQTHDLVCYDSLPLFDNAHPYNFKRTSLGYFCNVFYGAPLEDVANNCGFKPLAGPFTKNAGTGEWEYDADASVSTEDAYINLWETITQVAAVKMADGITPRFLKPRMIVCGPQLRKNVTEITKASFVAMQQGTQEIKGVITALGLAEPVFLQELGGLPSANQHEEYDWFIVCDESVASSEIGCINVGIREPFSVKLFTSATVPSLAISERVQSIAKMRAFVGVGQPQFIFKNRAPALS